MDRIVARYRWTYHLYALGGMLHERTRRKQRLLSYAFIIIALMVIAGATLWEGNLKVGAAVIGTVVFAGFFAFFFTFFLISPFLKKWQFNRRPDANAEIEWTFTRSEIITSTVWGSFTAPWSSYHGVTTTSYGFLVFSHPKVHYFIPNDAFETPDHIDALKILARENARNFSELP